MNQNLRNHADRIVREAIAAVQPDAAVQRALQHMEFQGRVLLVSGGVGLPGQPDRKRRRRNEIQACDGPHRELCLL